jgi:hypothetical protein
VLASVPTVPSGPRPARDRDGPTDAHQGLDPERPTSHARRGTVDRPDARVRGSFSTMHHPRTEDPLQAGRAEPARLLVLTGTRVGVSRGGAVGDDRRRHRGTPVRIPRPHHPATRPSPPDDHDRRARRRQPDHDRTTRSTRPHRS